MIAALSHLVVTHGLIWVDRIIKNNNKKKEQQKSKVLTRRARRKLEVKGKFSIGYWTWANLTGILETGLYLCIGMTEIWNHKTPTATQWRPRALFYFLVLIQKIK